MKINKKRKKTWRIWIYLNNVNIKSHVNKTAQKNRYSSTTVKMNYTHKLNISMKMPIILPTIAPVTKLGINKPHGTYTQFKLYLLFRLLNSLEKNIPWGQK